VTIHKNARLTSLRREGMALSVIDGGLSKAGAAQAPIGWYYEKHDEDRNIGLGPKARKIGLGPQRDWASHGADAFGMMCVACQAPNEFDDDEDDRQQSFHETRSAITGY
jgi:hypothetical protein